MPMPQMFRHVNRRATFQTIVTAWNSNDSISACIHGGAKPSRVRLGGALELLAGLCSPGLLGTQKLQQAFFSTSAEVAATSTGLLEERLLPETKLCSNCKEEKPSNAFRRSRHSRNGLEHFCIPCKIIEAEKIGAKGPSLNPTFVQEQCSRCGEVKPADEFYRDASRKSGLQSRCKTCTDAAVKGVTARIRGLPGDRGASVRWKFCARCQVPKASEDFARDSYRIDGLCAYCKMCRKEIRGHSVQRLPEISGLSGTLVCSKCGRHLPVSKFNQKMDSATGRQHWCKECKNNLGRQLQGRGAGRSFFCWLSHWFWDN